MLHGRSNLAKLTRPATPQGQERSLEDLGLTFVRFIENEGEASVVLANHKCEHTFQVFKTRNLLCPRFYFQLSGDFGDGHAYLK